MANIQDLYKAITDIKKDVIFTPAEVAEFMCDLADIKEGDIMLDNACGLGVLLQAAADRGAQSIGIELREDIVVKGNELHEHKVYHGSGLDLEILARIKEIHTPNKLIINPPYGVKGVMELDFLLKGLNTLTSGGLGVIISPLSNGMKMGIKDKALRKALMKQHTLKAIYKMKNDLFEGVGVHVQILVFEAHKPHSTETLVIDYTEDKVVDEVIAMVKATDEWCYEAHMQTNYERLVNDELFISGYRDAIANQIKAELLRYE